MPLISFLMILVAFAAVAILTLVLGLWMQLPLAALGVALVGGSLIYGLRTFA